MPSRRQLKAASAVREVLGMAILTEINDPRVKGVTITKVEMMPDMRQARVHVSLMGTETEQALCLCGLKSSAGFLQSKVAKRIETRYTPRLEFVVDEGVKKSIAMAGLLNRVLPREDQASHQGDDSATNDGAQDSSFSGSAGASAAGAEADSSARATPSAGGDYDSL